MTTKMIGKLPAHIVVICEGGHERIVDGYYIKHRTGTVSFNAYNVSECPFCKMLEVRSWE